MVFFRSKLENVIICNHLFGLIVRVIVCKKNEVQNTGVCFPHHNMTNEVLLFPIICTLLCYLFTATWRPGSTPV